MNLNGDHEQELKKAERIAYLVAGHLKNKLTEEEKRVAVRAAKAIGLNICAVDMMITPTKQYILRLDASPGLENIELTTKRNVTAKIIEYIEKNAKQRNRKDKVGA